MSDKNKQNFNGGWIKASQEAYDLLIGLGYKSKYISSQEYGYYYIEKSYAKWLPETPKMLKKLDNFKQFYINNGALSWDEPKGEEMKTISITDEDGKVYEFEKPDFECELLKVFAHRDKKYLDLMIALIWDDEPCEKGALDGHKALLYTLGGKACDEPYKTSGRYNLTPIKPKWYEDESNFPAILICKETENDFRIVFNFTSYCRYSNTYRLATKAERDSLTVGED